MELGRVEYVSTLEERRYEISSEVCFESLTAKWSGKSVLHLVAFLIRILAGYTKAGNMELDLRILILEPTYVQKSGEKIQIISPFPPHPAHPNFTLLKVLGVKDQFKMQP